VQNITQTEAFSTLAPIILYKRTGNTIDRLLIGHTYNVCIPT